MNKTETVRARVGDVLKSRIKNHIAREKKRGFSLGESSIVEAALVEFLDRAEGKPQGYVQGVGGVAYPVETSHALNEGHGNLPTRKEKTVRYTGGVK